MDNALPTGRGPKKPQYDWMLQLSSEGWAWEFLRRNPVYREDFALINQADELTASKAALRWGLLRFTDPGMDARTAVVFWSPTHNRSVLPLVTAEEGGSGMVSMKCKVSILEIAGSPQHHVLFSCDGRFLQLAISGAGDLGRVRYLVDALPEHGGAHKLTALRRLADLIQHKRLRPELYSRQRRGPRLLRIVEILDSSAVDPSHRSIAYSVFGKERADREWENLRDHIRRAVAAGRKLTQGGYLSFLR